MTSWVVGLFDGAEDFGDGPFLWLFFGNGGRVAGHCGWVFIDGFLMGGFAV